MNNEIDVLRQRVQQLETTALEHTRLEHLIEYAAQGQDLARYAGEGVLYVDLATHGIIDANAAALELLGYSRDELLRLSITELEIQGEPSSTTPRTYIETSIEEQVYPAVYRHRLGHQVLVKVYKRLMYKDNREVLHYRLEDKSLYKRLWHELQRREDDGFKFQQKLRMLNEITIELSRIDTHDALCRTAVKLGIDDLGFDRMGMWFLDVEHHVMVGSYGVNEQGELRAEHDQHWSYNDTYIMDFIAGKTEVALAHDDSPLYNEKSEIIQYGWHISAPMLNGSRFIGILTVDNYLRKQPMTTYDPEILRLYGIIVGHLIELARAREQALSIRLEQERTNMLRQFITNVGHDFRTPLSVINTKSYLIQHTQEADRRQSLANGITQQITYISKMLDRILEFVELECGPVLTLAAIDLREALLLVIDSQQALSASKHIQYEIDEVALENGRTVSGDLYYLRRALSEILDNAVQYTPDGGKVRVSFMAYPNEIGISIQDSGIGVEKHALNKVFTPLYRVDEARTERRNGLGLAIAKMIVQAHYGRISAESIPGKGSTFEVILPKYA